jgi:hypothetical protein
VSFNGQAAFSFTATSSTRIDAVVPGGATTGGVTVTGPQGSATSATFTVDPPLPPTISSFSPGTLASGSIVTLSGTHFVGATQVQFNGVNAAAFTVLSDTQIRATAPAGLTAGTLSVITPGGTAFSAAYGLGTAFQVLMNTTFEQASPLIWRGDTGIIQSAPGSGDPGVLPHAGAKFAWLGGYGSVASDQITQDFYIPSTVLRATATFYLKILSGETGAAIKDTLTVTALSPSNATLGTLLTKSNLDASEYTAYSVDLFPFKGQVVRLSFKSQEDASSATSFLLDDVVVNLTVASSAELKPVITSFTPTSGLAGEGSVQIAGQNFFGLSTVTLGGVAAVATLVDGTSLSAAIPAAAPAGSAPISLTNAQGTGTSATNFSVVYGAPSIRGLNPTQGPVGTPVVITGAYLGYPGTTLTLNGQPLTLSSQTTGQITFTVPPGATSGSLVLSSSGGSVTRSFTVNMASTTLDLHVDRLQLTQSTQTLDNTVPIVAGKNGLIRVFLVANQANTATPTVQVTLLNNGLPVAGYPKGISSVRSDVPTTVDEASLGASWNLTVPGTDLTTPLGTGYALQALVDPGSAIPEADTTNNTLQVPLSGAVVPSFKTTLYPVVLSSGIGDITEANKDAWVARLAKMYPVAGVDVTVGAAFTPSSSTLTSDSSAWSTLLNELATKHQADGASDRYYFGAVKVSYGSGIAGIGYVPSSSSSGFAQRTALGWDKSGYQDGGNFPEVFAHETGHNMGRQHSPCGSVEGADPGYPYSGGLIGVWGYDSALNVLKAPTTYKDIMGYCSPNWVSDYVYRKILDFRGGTGGFLKVGEEDVPSLKDQAGTRDCLLVRGLVHANGEVEFLPAFRTRALPTALNPEGEFLLEGLDAQGLPLFSTALELMEVGCGAQERERHFVAALALEAPVLDAITGLKVLRAGRMQASLRPLPSPARSQARAPGLQRLSEDRLQLTWDATLHPAALVRDADTGEVLALLAAGRQTFISRARRLELVLSDGVTSRTHVLEAAD